MFDLGDEQEMIVSSLEDIVAEEFAEDAFEWKEDPPWERVRILAKQGFLGTKFNEIYGSGGIIEFEVLLITEVVRRVCPDKAEFIYNQQMIVPRAFEMFGTGSRVSCRGDEHRNRRQSCPERREDLGE